VGDHPFIYKNRPDAQSAPALSCHRLVAVGLYSLTYAAMMAGCLSAHRNGERKNMRLVQTL